jgi:hypothetical protein
MPNQQQRTQWPAGCPSVRSSGGIQIVHWGKKIDSAMHTPAADGQLTGVADPPHSLRAPQAANLFCVDDDIGKLFPLIIAKIRCSSDCPPNTAWRRDITTGVPTAAQVRVARAEMSRNVAYSMRKRETRL